MNSDFIDQEIYKFLFGDIFPEDIEEQHMPRLKLEEIEEIIPKIFPDTEIIDDMYDGFERVYRMIVDASYRKLRRNNPDVADTIDKIYGVI